MTVVDIVIRNKLQRDLILGQQNIERARVMFKCDSPTHQQLCEAWIDSPAFNEFNGEYIQSTQQFNVQTVRV